MPSELIGLEVSSFRAPGSRPLHFAIAREAGRLDCAGNGGNSAAVGNCRFAENPAFTQLLVSRGIGRPTREQAFGADGGERPPRHHRCGRQRRLPAPSIDNLMALAALGVNGRYIADMAHAGYRPRTIQSLIEFKALGITPDWIGGFARVGYANLPGDGLVQMRALGITPDYIAGFQRIGYGNLPVEQAGRAQGARTSRRNSSARSPATARCRRSTSSPRSRCSAESADRCSSRRS